MENQLVKNSHKLVKIIISLLLAIVLLGLFMSNNASNSLLKERGSTKTKLNANDIVLKDNNSINKISSTPTVLYTQEKLSSEAIRNLTIEVAELLAEAKKKSYSERLFTLYEKNGYSTKHLKFSYKILLIEFKEQTIAQVLLITESKTNSGPSQSQNIFLFGIKDGYLHTIMCEEIRNFGENIGCRQKTFDVFGEII